MTDTATAGLGRSFEQTTEPTEPTKLGYKHLGTI